MSEGREPKYNESPPGVQFVKPDEPPARIKSVMGKTRISDNDLPRKKSLNWTNEEPDEVSP